MPITAHSQKSASIMVDIPFFGPPKGNEKFIFRRNADEPVPFSLSVKKFFWKKQMCQAAKERVEKIWTNGKFTELFGIEGPCQKISNNDNSDGDGIDELKVIDAFADAIFHRECKRAFSDSPKENRTEGSAEYVLPEELEAKVLSQKPEFLLNDLSKKIKKIFEEKNSLDSISGIRGSDALKNLENYLTSPSQLKTREEYATLFELLNSAKIAIGHPDSPYLKIIAEKINELHAEIDVKYQNLLKIEKRSALSQALQSDLLALTKTVQNQNALSTFLDFIENPEDAFKQPQTKSALVQFINEFNELLHKLKPATRDQCLEQVDMLEGRLLMEAKTYLPDLSKFVSATRPELPALLEALHAKSEESGPSASLFNLFQYAQYRKVAINQVSYWYLRSLSPEVIKELHDGLPDFYKKYFIKITDCLKQDLIEFKKIMNSAEIKDKKIFYNKKINAKINSGASDKNTLQPKEATKLQKNEPAKAKPKVRKFTPPDVWQSESQARKDKIEFIKAKLVK